MSNNGPTMDPPMPMADARLKSYIDRLERLDEERASLSADMKDIFVEVGSAGFDKVVVRRLLAERKRIAKVGQQEHETQELLLSTYRAAIDRLGSL